MPKWFRRLILPVFLLAAAGFSPVTGKAQEGAAQGGADDDRLFRLRLAPEMAESGLMAHVLPRFALKSGRRAEISDTTEPDAVIGLADPGGPAMLARGEARFALRLMTPDRDALAFRDWLASDPGQAAVAGFVPAEGAAFFVLPPEAAATAIVFDGDPDVGRGIARAHCARCHVTAPGERGGIGSTPSFMALRALADWAARFMSFYALNPHPSFLRVEGLSPPFDPALPPSVIPIVITMDEAEAIMAYAAGLTPADLGAEVEAR